MKFMVENLGLLNQAEIEIGDLTILCGENNSGKTYAVYAFYGFWRLFNENIIELVLRHQNSFIQKGKNIIAVEEAKFIQIHANLKNEMNELYKNKLAKVLGGNADIYKDAKFELSFEILNYEKIFKQKNSLFNVYKTDENIIFEFFDRDDLSSQNIQNIYLFLADLNFIIRRLFYRHQINIISVERTGIAMFYNELNINRNNILAGLTQNNQGNIIDNINNYIQKTTSRYPLPITDNISLINDISIVTNQKSFIVESKNNEILDLLWQIVGGKYIINDYGLQFATDAKQKILQKHKTINIQQTSSSVKSLFLLDLYIRFQAQESDILIIDEPELNLHPKNQILLARLLVMLVNIGIKVFISTHSDYILREFSSCICLKNVSDENLKNLREYNKQMQLDANKVRAYQTIKNKGKITANSVKITQEDGIYMNTFNDIIKEQNRNQDKIYEQILKSQS
ncbi:MAG: AAA family ATPase [Campylobacter sp.]|uniref:AAA family ATPase n=1 Tax=Campylobacter sp. TaxID=205 RepID=UPI002A8400B3|nr:AAA family ATPase [Campylobacter sp.]MCI7587695.1 ATP-binding protein [Campylobacter sp.]MDY5115405.1 AAA family ATPase [Campylobacter sp.]